MLKRGLARPCPCVGVRFMHCNCAKRSKNNHQRDAHARATASTRLARSSRKPCNFLNFPLGRRLLQVCVCAFSLADKHSCAWTWASCWSRTGEVVVLLWGPLRSPPTAYFLGQPRDSFTNLRARGKIVASAKPKAALGLCPEHLGSLPLDPGSPKQ